jgi:hypothetical protein
MDAVGSPVTLFRTEVAGLRLLGLSIRTRKEWLDALAPLPRNVAYKRLRGEGTNCFRDVRLPPRGLSICLVVRWRKRPAQVQGIDDKRQIDSGFTSM